MSTEQPRQETTGADPSALALRPRLPLATLTIAKLENVAIAMHCNLRLPDNELVVLRCNYDTVPRMKSVYYPFLSCGVLMLIRNVRL